MQQPQGLGSKFVQIISSADWLAQNILNILKTLGLVDFNRAELQAGENGAQSLGHVQAWRLGSSWVNWTENQNENQIQAWNWNQIEAQKLNPIKTQNLNQTETQNLSQIETQNLYQIENQHENQI